MRGPLGGEARDGESLLAMGGGANGGGIGTES
jgi:hypothetical protein